MCTEPRQLSPELVSFVDSKDGDEEPGSFSPELVRDYDGDEVVDPEHDKAELVCWILLQPIFGLGPYIVMLRSYLVQAHL